MLRAQEENGLFRQLEAEWGRQCDAFGEDIDEYATPSMAHAREIVAGKHDTDKYGIYVLVNDTHHECLAHCNVARLPGTTGKTMRMVWVLLAPKYDFDETEPKVLASIAAALVTETIRLSAGNEEPQMRADHIKIHLGGVGDRQFFSGVAHALQGAGHVQDVAIRGNWLHMSHC